MTSDQWRQEIFVYINKKKNVCSEPQAEYTEYTSKKKILPRRLPSRSPFSTSPSKLPETLALEKSVESHKT